MPWNISFLYLSSIINTPNFNTLLLNIYEIIKSEDYNNFNHWYYNKVIPGVINGSREIIVCFINQEIAGITVLKKDQKEKKICTLFVVSKFRNNGIGTLLIKRSFNFLGTTKPLITINEQKIPLFIRIIQKFNWKQTQTLDVGYYNKEFREIVFNGTIT